MLQSHLRAALSRLSQLQLLPSTPQSYTHPPSVAIHPWTSRSRLVRFRLPANTPLIVLPRLGHPTIQASLTQRDGTAVVGVAEVTEVVPPKVDLLAAVLQRAALMASVLPGTAHLIVAPQAEALLSAGLLAVVRLTAARLDLASTTTRSFDASAKFFALTSSCSHLRFTFLTLRQRRLAQTLTPSRAPTPASSALSSPAARGSSVRVLARSSRTPTPIFIALIMPSPFSAALPYSGSSRISSKALTSHLRSS